MKISKHQIYTKKNNIFKLRKQWKTHNKAIINKKNRTIQKIHVPVGEKHSSTEASNTQENHPFL